MPRPEAPKLVPYAGKPSAGGRGSHDATRGDNVPARDIANHFAVGIDTSRAKYDPKRDGHRRWTDPQAEFFGDPPIGRSALDERRDRECCTIAPRS